MNEQTYSLSRSIQRRSPGSTTESLPRNSEQTVESPPPLTWSIVRGPGEGHPRSRDPSLCSKCMQHSFKSETPTEFSQHYLFCSRCVPPCAKEEDTIESFHEALRIRRAFFNGVEKARCKARKQYGSWKKDLRDAVHEALDTKIPASYFSYYDNTGQKMDKYQTKRRRCDLCELRQRTHIEDLLIHDFPNQRSLYQTRNQRTNEPTESRPIHGDRTNTSPILDLADRHKTAYNLRGETKTTRNFRDRIKTTLLRAKL